MHSAVVFGGDDESAQEAWRRHVPPDNEVAGTVAVDAVVSRTDSVAVTLRFLRVHSTGVLLSFVLQRRSDPDPMTAFPLRPVDTDVLLGVELADGSTVAVSPGGGFDATGPRDRQAPVLHLNGGGGGGREYEMVYWLTPLPPSGDLVVVVASVPLALPEARVIVTAQALAAARDRCVALWPREPDRPCDPGTHASPEVPPGGWFERVLGTGPGIA